MYYFPLLSLLITRKIYMILRKKINSHHKYSYIFWSKSHWIRGMCPVIIIILLSTSSLIISSNLLEICSIPRAQAHFIAHIISSLLWLIGTCPCSYFKIILLLKRILYHPRDYQGYIILPFLKQKYPRLILSLNDKKWIFT